MQAQHGGPVLGGDGRNRAPKIRNRSEKLTQELATSSSRGLPVVGGPGDGLAGGGGRWAQPAVGSRRSRGIASGCRRIGSGMVW